MKLDKIIKFRIAEKGKDYEYLRKRVIRNDSTFSRETRGCIRESMEAQEEKGGEKK